MPCQVFIFAALYPAFVKKLILIGSGTYQEKYALNIMETRLSRLSKEEKAEALSLIKTLNEPAIGDKNTPMARLGKLTSKADSYDPLPHKGERLECQHDIYQNVWEQARKLRSSGKLLEFGKKIQCPLVAISLLKNESTCSAPNPSPCRIDRAPSITPGCRRS